MPDPLSEKERALIESARREAADRKFPPPTGPAEAVKAPAPVTAKEPAPAPPERSAILVPAAAPRPVVPVVPIVPIAIAAAGPDAIAQRIALLMESERQEKAQRLKQQQRWKIGAIGVFVVLAGWSALTLISYLRH